MKSDAESRSPLFNFPVLLALTAIVCMVVYQVFGLNTAAGVAFCSILFTWCALRRKPQNAEAN